MKSAAEKLERLMRERDGSVRGVSVRGVGKKFRYIGASNAIGASSAIIDADTLTEAIDKAYEAAFPTRKLEPGDLFYHRAYIYRVLPGDALQFFDQEGWHDTGSKAENIGDTFTIIGKAYDETIEAETRDE